ncbi:MAG TPA: hypothetical protein VK745_26705 [Polyangiaceae bacterium]|nr:hypothetical protein [Polyangiaceae bacterium]
MPRLATTLVGAICLASTFWARRSAAEARPEPIAWTYRAPPDCPPAETFEREFRARTTRAELVSGAADASRHFLVTLSSEPDRAVGRIEIDGPAGAVATREVAGQTCAGVVSALALVAALTVDPLAAESPLATAASQPDAAPVAKPSPDAAPNEARRAPEPRATRDSVEGTPVSAAPMSRLVVAAGLDGGVVMGLFPQPAPSASVFAEAQLERSSALAPSARLSLSGAASSSVAAPPGSATFRWLAAAFDGCPFELRLANTLRVTPCAFLEVGVLAGSGAGVTTPEVDNRRWVALGGSARLKWLLSESFFVEAQGRLEAPVARDTFVLAVPERVVVYAVPAVLGSLKLGAGIRWR